MASVKKNFAYQCIYEILVIIMPFLTSPYISRILGATNLGIYAYTYSVAGYFVLFSMLGLKYYGNRTVAQKKDTKAELDVAFSEILVFKILWAVVIFLVYIVYIFFFDIENKEIAVAQLFYVSSGILNISFFYFGMEKFEVTVKRSIIFKILGVVSIFAFVKTKDDLLQYTLIMSVSSMLSELFLWINLKKHVDIVRVKWKNVLKHVKPIFILFVPLLSASIYQTMDKIVLGNMCDIIQLGYYDNAQKIINIPMTVIIAFGNVMMPKMSNLYTKNKNNTEYILKAAPFLMFMSFAMMFGIMGISNQFSVVFWGSEFYACGRLMKLYAVVIPFYAMANCIRTQYLIPKGRDKVYTIAILIGGIVNITLNYYFIPRFEALGAVMTTIIAEALVCIIQLLMVNQEFPTKAFLKKSIFFVFNGGFMLLCISCLDYFIENTLVLLVCKILVGGGIYTLLAGLYFIFTKNKEFLDMLDKIKGMCRKLM